MILGTNQIKTNLNETNRNKKINNKPMNKHLRKDLTIVNNVAINMGVQTAF